MKSSVGCENLDRLLEGGLESGTITEIYGEAGSGKTNFCLQATVARARAKQRVVFIDTEGVSMERLSQICGDDDKSVKKMLLFSEVHDFQSQEEMVEKAVKIGLGNEQVGLIVVDTMTGHFRRDFFNDEGPKSLAPQIKLLLTYARKMKKPVIVTSQVYSDVERGVILPLGGHVLHHNSKTILELSKVHGKTGVRKATIRKHRHIVEGKNTLFKIENSGLCDYGGQESVSNV
ncbi:MAG TPA: DNA repair and recombination protein RadB [Euryarchaeota archaeon]|nr:DNA repair and recombination protein RadB [Euryarchaeota archaeon]